MWELRNLTIAETAIFVCVTHIAKFFRILNPYKSLRMPRGVIVFDREE